MSPLPTSHLDKSLPDTHTCFPPSGSTNALIGLATPAGKTLTPLFPSCVLEKVMTWGLFPLL